MDRNGLAYKKRLSKFQIQNFSIELALNWPQQMQSIVFQASGKSYENFFRPWFGTLSK